MREAGIIVPKVKTTKMALSTCKQRVVLDMSYDKMMTFKVNNRCIIAFYATLFVTHNNYETRTFSSIYELSIIYTKLQMYFIEFKSFVKVLFKFK